MATETTVTDILIRTATAADLEPLAVFLTPFVEAGKLLPRTFDELRDLLPTLFVAEFEGQIVGCAALEIYSWKLAEVRSLAVSSAMQGRGWASGWWMPALIAHGRRTSLK